MTALISTKTNVEYPLYFKRDIIYSTSSEDDDLYSCESHPEKCKLVRAKDIWDKTTEGIMKNAICKKQRSNAFPLLKNNLGTLAEALAKCYASSPGCWGLSATKRDGNPDIYTGINTFIACEKPDPKDWKRFREGKWTKVYYRVIGTDTFRTYNLFNRFGFSNIERLNADITNSNYQQFMFYAVGLATSGDEYEGTLAELKINPDPEGTKFAGGKANWQQEQWDMYNKMVHGIGGAWGICQPQGGGGCEGMDDTMCGQKRCGNCNKNTTVQFTDACQCSVDSYALNIENRDTGGGTMPWIMHGPIGQSTCNAKEKVLEDKICALCNTPKCHWLYLRKGFQLKSNCYKGYTYGDTLEESMDNYYNSICRLPDIGKEGTRWEPLCTCDCPNWTVNANLCNAITRKVDDSWRSDQGFKCGKYEKIYLDNNQTNKDIADNLVNNKIGPDGKSTCGYEFEWNEETENIYDTPLCKRCAARTDIQPIAIDHSFPKVDPSGFLRDTGNEYASHSRGNGKIVKYGWNCDLSSPVSYHPFAMEKVKSKTMGFVDMGIQFAGHYKDIGQEFDMGILKPRRFIWQQKYTPYENKCPNNEDPKWELELPNGKYKVVLEGYFEKTSGCVIENSKFGAATSQVKEDDGRTKYVWIYYIALSDGRLTLRSDRLPPTHEYKKSDIGGDYGEWTTKPSPSLCIGYFTNIKVEKDTEVLKPIPFPTPVNTWWQLNVEEDGGEKENIGLIMIAPADIDFRKPSTKFNERTRWLMEGNWVGSGVEVGEFKDLDNMGFRVSLSDLPCNKIDGTCPPPHHICAVKNTPNFALKEKFDPYTQLGPDGEPIPRYLDVVECENVADRKSRCEYNCNPDRRKRIKHRISECFDLCMANTVAGKCRTIKKWIWGTPDGEMEAYIAPYEINCDGVAAKYVRVELPGSNRILDATVHVHRSKPLKKQLDKWPMGCYAIEYLDGTITNGPLNETNDPYDPVFYGTCYSLLPALQGWVKHPNRTKVINIHWRYGEKCLKCNEYKKLKNGAQSNIQGKLEFINWEEVIDYSGKCFNCDRLETGPWKLKEPRRMYKKGDDDENEISEMEKTTKFLIHEVTIIGISKDILKKNMEKVRIGLGNALGINPNYITILAVDAVEVKNSIDENTRSQLNDADDNDDEEEDLGPDFGIESSKDLYVDATPTTSVKSKITYEVIVESNAETLEKNMVSTNYHTAVAREVALATGMSPSDVRAEVNIEPKLVVIQQPSDDKGSNTTKDKDDGNNDSHIVILIICIVIGLVACLVSYGFSQRKKKNEQHDVFKAFKNARQTGDTDKVADNVRNGYKTKSVELSAVALVMPEEEKVITKLNNPYSLDDKKTREQFVSTFMGQGNILGYREDGFAVIHLINWQLAHGAKAILYIEEKKIQVKKQSI